jgi:hypothetical protein
MRKMRIFLSEPMSPRLAWVPAIAVVLAGGLYCLAYSVLSGRPEGIGTGVTWSVVTVLPWLFAFEFGKRINYDPTGSWKANWWIVAAILAVAAIISVCLQGVWAGELTHRGATIALLRRLPAAGFVLLLLLLVPELQRRAETRRTIESALPVPPQRIEWIKAAGNYVEVRTAQGMILSRVTMAAADSLLTEHGFLRVHRSALVNARHVKQVEHGKIADEIVLEDGTRLKVGGAYRSVVRRALDDR